MTTNPFLVHVARLRRAPATRWEVTCRGQLDDLACTGSAVPAGAEAEVAVTLESVAGGVSATGTVTAPWVGVCRRCLAEATGTLEVAVRELFTPGGDGEETYRLDGDELDLSPLVRDAVLLELPQAPLCGPACRGLCPSCGADRNQGDCGCRPQRDERWAALDVLRGPGPVGN